MITAIVSQKGGTGKTITALSIASGLQKFLNKKVLLIDIDPQANSSNILMDDIDELDPLQSICTTFLNEDVIPIYESRIPNVHLVPSHLSLAEVRDQLVKQTAIPMQTILRRATRNYMKAYDNIIIDCPPDLGLLFINGLAAADNYLITANPGFFGIDAIKQIQAPVDQIKKYHNPDLTELGILFTMSESTSATAETVKALNTYFPNRLIGVKIPKGTIVKNAELSKRTVFEIDENAPVSLAYKKLIYELFI